MAEIVNLRRARKAMARAEKERTAEASRAKFGRTKAQKDAARKQGDLEARRHGLHLRQSRDDE